MNIKDQIKSGKISFNVGDEVICFRRKPNGHPRGIKEWFIQLKKLTMMVTYTLL